MKKRITTILIATLILISSTSIYAQRTHAANLVTVIVDGRKIVFPDAPAYIDENGRTQLPARYIGEALGAYVEWDEPAKNVTVSRRSLAWEESNFAATIIDLHIGSDIYYTRVGNGTPERHEMDTQAVIEYNRTYVPVRYVAQALGASVKWDPQTKVATITSETKTVGGFVIPKSYTDTARYLDAFNATSFTVDTTKAYPGYTEVDNRLDILLSIFSQKFDTDTLQKLKGFCDDNMEFKPDDSYDFKYYKFKFGEMALDAYGITLFDQKSGQYVRLLRFSENNFQFRVFDLGTLPPEPES